VNFKGAAEVSPRLFLRCLPHPLIRQNLLKIYFGIKRMDQATEVIVVGFARIEIAVG
jgi:hypothetical protein